MQIPIPYMVAVKNLGRIMTAIQKAAAPDSFTVDFLKDLGFTSSNDRGVTKVLKYIGFLDPAGKPTSYYREFMDIKKGDKVLARRLVAAYDDLFTADREAHDKTSASLKGWFKTKTGSGDAVAEKLATTFKTLADLANFDGIEEAVPQKEETKTEGSADDVKDAIKKQASVTLPRPAHVPGSTAIGLVYRVEIHLPDTQNVDTFRAIFKALREELM